MAVVEGEIISEVGVRLDALVESLRLLPDGLSVSQISRCERRLAAERVLAAAHRAGSSGDVGIDRRRARNELSDRQSSSRSINRDAKRAAAVAANEQLGRQLADGAIGPEAIDSLLKAADGESGDLPDDLVDAVAGLNPDQVARTVDHYLEEQAGADDVEKRHRRQMKARRVFRYEATAAAGRPALAGIGIEGPDEMIARIWGQLNVAADAEYQSDGGRDRSNSEHRSVEQRRFDSLAKMLSGDESTCGSGAGRPAVVITVAAEQLFDDPDAGVVPTQLGSGPIPKSVLDSYLSEASLSVLVTGIDGAPLWLGRARRHASQAQFIALAVRDRGCVLCRATIDRCIAHHLMPWSAPGRGRTDIDQMALLCQRCHRDLHHRNHTLYQTNQISGHHAWATRPATPNETPAAPPQHRQRE